jgi:hypothetical protein
VRELVVHWMITGRLDYPFAVVPPAVPSCDGNHSLDLNETKPIEVDVRGSRLVGELAVHRESLTRILQENPQSLSGVLEALIAAIGGSTTNAQTRQVSKEQPQVEELALTPV